MAIALSMTTRRALPELQRHSLRRLGIELPDDEELHRLWHDFISGHWHQAAKDFVARYVLDLLYLNGRTLADSQLASDFIRRLNQPVLEGHPIKEASKRDQSEQQTVRVPNSLADVETGEQLIALVKKNDPKLYQQMQEEVWKDDDAAEWGATYLAAAGNPDGAIDVLRQHLKDNLADKQDTIEPAAEREEDDGVETASPEEYVIACCKDWIDR